MGGGIEIPGSGERDRCLRALMELCVESGEEQVSPADVAERAGVGLERFEALFAGGLPECMTACEQAMVARVMEVVSVTYSADRSAWDSGILGMAAILRLFAADPVLAHFGYITATYSRVPQVRESAEGARRVLASMIDKLRETVADPLAPPSAARAAIGSADALVRREIAAGRAERLPELLPDLVYGVVVPFLGQAEALRMASAGLRLLEAEPRPLQGSEAGADGG